MVNSILKWPNLIIAFIVIGFTFTGCGGVRLTPSAQKAFDSGQIMYTKRNMFISKFGRRGQRFIETTNYGNGQIIPVNTPVKLKAINKKQLVFTYSGGLVVLKNIPKYSNTTMGQIVSRYFGSKKVNLNKFTKLERDAIKSINNSFGVSSLGTNSSTSGSKIVVGMSKQAVLVSRGYPPTHATSSTKSNSWKFWETKFNTRIVEFRDNKVYRITE